MIAQDHKAREFEATVASKLGALRTIAYRYSGNPADAEDAVQDALLLAYRKLHQFRGDSCMLTWLGRIVINCSFMQRRRDTRHTRISDEQEESFFENLSDTKASAEEMLLAQIREDWLQPALARLTPRLRSATLCYLAGLSLKESAVAMDCPVGTVKARLSRARSQLSKSAQRTGL